MRYIVKEFDKPLLIFSADMNSSNSNLQIEKIYEENDAFFPLNLTVSNGGLESWLRKNNACKTKRGEKHAHCHCRG